MVLKVFPKGDFLGLLICCSQKNSDQETLKIPFVAISFNSNLRLTGLIFQVYTTISGFSQEVEVHFCCPTNTENSCNDGYHRLLRWVVLEQEAKACIIQPFYKHTDKQLGGPGKCFSKKYGNKG